MAQDKITSKQQEIVSVKDYYKTEGGILWPRINLLQSNRKY